MRKMSLLLKRSVRIGAGCNERENKKKVVSRVMLLIAIICLLIIFLTGSVLAQIPNYHQFYGKIRDNDNNLVLGSLEIKAYINNVVKGSCTSSNGLYGYSNLCFVENGVDGDNINFYVNDYFSSDYVFSNEELSELNLILICVDVDNDGYGKQGTDISECRQASYDCNDGNSGINPGASEICGNGVDENCNGFDASCGGNGGGGVGSSGGGGGGGGDYIPISPVNMTNETYIEFNKTEEVEEEEEKKVEEIEKGIADEFSLDKFKLIIIFLGAGVLVLIILIILVVRHIRKRRVMLLKRKLGRK